MCIRDRPNTEALMRAVLALFEKVVGLNHNLPEEAYTCLLYTSRCV